MEGDQVEEQGQLEAAIAESDPQQIVVEPTPVGVDIGVLYREFPAQAIKERTVGGGRRLSYVEGHSVIHRLNEATGNRWDLVVRAIDVMQIGTQTVVRAHVALTIPGLGTREHIGVQAVADRSGEDLVKGAVTDALKKASTLFGVGLHLYGPDYEAGETAPPPAPSPQQVQQAVSSVIKKMPSNQVESGARLSFSMIESINNAGLGRGLTELQINDISRALYGEEVAKLDVEMGRQCWAFLTKASTEDLRRAMGGY